ncbi:thrombospondin type 3 repeat-containing protein, partial [Tenacibaculum sp.]|nr:thrombospondin type 3 repeat-containing protein [Tenacibaculum sp.]
MLKSILVGPARILVFFGFLFFTSFSSQSQVVNTWGLLSGTVPETGLQTSSLSSIGDGTTMVTVDIARANSTTVGGGINAIPPALTLTSSFDNSRASVGLSGNTYTYTFSEPVHVILSSQEHNDLVRTENIKISSPDTGALFKGTIVNGQTGHFVVNNNTSEVHIGSTALVTTTGTYWTAESSIAITTLTVEYFVTDASEVASGEPFTLDLAPIPYVRLDDTNSSGAGGININVPGCAKSYEILDNSNTGATSVFNAQHGLSSMSITLTNPQDAGLEELSIKGIFPGISVAGNSTTSLIVTNVSADVNTLRNTLDDLVYINKATVPEIVTPRIVNITVTDPFGNTSAVVMATVTLSNAPNSGSVSGPFFVFTTGSTVDLDTSLNGSPDPGTWVDVGGTGALSGSTLTISGIPLGASMFNYVVSGTTPCSDEVTSLTVIKLEGNELALTAPSASSNCATLTTSYADPLYSANSDDPIYIFNGGTNSGQLECPAGGVGTVYDWYKFDNTSNSYEAHALGASATQTGLADGGYLVVRNDGGIIREGRAWVWNTTIDTNAGTDVSACEGDTVTLNGVSAGNGNFTFYNPVQRPFTITPTTIVTVTFNITHTYISDVAWYLVSPDEAVTIPLGINEQGNPCYAVDNAVNLTFTNDQTITPTLPVFDMCVLSRGLGCPTSGAALTGTFNRYYTNPSNNSTVCTEFSPASGDTAIDMSGLTGYNARQGGWKVQVYDCENLDVGEIDSVTITFDDGLGTTQTFTSGTLPDGDPSVQINDGACTAATASIYEVPFTAAVAINEALNIQDNIGVNNTGGYEWSYSTVSATGPFSASFENGTLSPNVVVNETTWFKLKVDNGTSCTGEDVVQVTVVDKPNSGIGTDAYACAGDAIVNLNSLISGGDLGGTWSVSVTSPDAPGGNFSAGAGTYNPTAGGVYVFDYTVNAVGACTVNAVTPVTVSVQGAPNTGTNTTIDAYIIPSEVVNLFSSLSGSPTSGGIWSLNTGSAVPGVNFDQGAGTFNTAGISEGAYIFDYTIVNCTTSVSTLTINVLFDTDGISATIEDGAPNGGDGNNDGTPDKEQSNVASMPVIGGSYVTLEVSSPNIGEDCNQITAMTLVNESDLPIQDEDFDYPFGLIDFSLACSNNGETANVKYYWHGISSSSQYVDYRKYGPSTASGTDLAYRTDLISIAKQIETVNLSNVLTAVYNITDDAPGDDNTESAGVIDDPTGPATAADSDGDGIPNISDACPGFDDAVDIDGDLVPDGCDQDDDNDGILDTVECGTINEVVFNWTTLGLDPQIAAGVGGQTITDIGTILGITELVGVDITVTYLYDGVGTALFSANNLDQTGAAGTDTGVNFYTQEGTVTFTLSSPFNLKVTNGSGRLFTGESLTYGPAASGSIVGDMSIVNSSPAGAVASDIVITDDSVSNPAYVTLVDTTDRPEWHSNGPISTVTYTPNGGNGEAGRFALLYYTGNCDLDGDGIPNNKDLDSDNDGIYDVLEAGGVDIDGNGIADGIPNTTTGIPSSAGTGVTPTDSGPTSGTPDYLDLDSDEDGCSDANEAFLDSDADGADDGQYGTGNPAAVNLNGTVIGADYSTGTNSDVITNGPDPDSDGLANTCDLDDDNDGNPDTGDPNAIVPTVADDSGSTDSNTPVIINILSNDDYLNNNDTNNTGNTIITPVSNSGGGVVTYDASTGDMQYEPVSADGGTTVTVVYQVCNDVNNDTTVDGNGVPTGGTADDVCAQANIVITVSIGDADNDGVPDNVDVCPGSDDTVDNDSDGVPDGCDQDNDNDGILDSVECPSGGGGTSSSFIANGDFNENYVDVNNPGTPYATGQVNSAPSPWGQASTPDISATTFADFNGTDLALTSLPGFDPSPVGGSFMGFRSNFGGTPANDEGVFNGLQIDDINEEITIQFYYTEYTPDQTFVPSFAYIPPSTVPAADPLVNIGFKLDLDNSSSGLPFPTPAEFETTVLNITNFDSSGSTPGSWEIVTVTFIPSAVGVTTPGTYPFYVGSLGSSLNTWVFVDALVVVPTSSLNCDADGDGVPNNLDLDADNDGIYDVVEAGGTDTDGNGIADGVANTTTGVPSTAGIGLVPTDSGATVGTPNYLDLDSDEDGCSDANEFFNNGTADGGDGGSYGTGEPQLAINANGTVTGVTYGLATAAADTDSNSVADYQEGTVGAPLPDPDTDLTANACDLDDDNDGNPDTTDPNTQTPTAVNDVATATAGVAEVIQVLSNDDFLNQGDAANLGTTTIVNAGSGSGVGAISFNATTGELVYTPTTAEGGSTVTVNYTVCNTNPTPDICDTATVTITVAIGDEDKDGVPDNVDVCPGFNDTVDNDSDGVPDGCDQDDDNDGILDVNECSVANYTPVYHVFDPDFTYFNGTNLDVFLQENGIASSYVDIQNDGVNPFGQPTNVVDDFNNLAYDDGIWYIIRGGNLWQSNDLVTNGGTFTNLGNAQVPAGVDNLAYDNGTFYHLFDNAGTVEIYSSTNPVGTGWTLMCTTSLTPTQADGLAVHDGVFYAMDSLAGVAFTQLAYRTNDPCTAAAWTDITPGAPGLDLGFMVANFAMGNADFGSFGCDFDGDGVLNQFDLDADNDGIYDVVEAGGTDADGNGIADGTPNTTTGIPATAATGLTPTDSGATVGSPNYLDLDSDEDGCSDANEFFNNGTADGGDGGSYGTGEPQLAVNANGTVTGVTYGLATAAADTDSNSVADYIEGTVAAPLPDPDADLTANACDLDDDGDGNPDTTDPNPAAPTVAADTNTVDAGVAVVTNVLTNDDYLGETDPG